MLGETYSKMFRLKALKYSLDVIIFKMALILIHLFNVIILRYCISFSILKIIKAPIWLWVLFWVQIPLMMFLEPIEKWLNTLIKQGDDLRKVIKNI